MIKRFVVVDTETTGNRVHRKDKIIQIGIVLIENGQIIDRFSSFVNPEIPVSSFIENFTGITDEMLKTAPIFESIAPKIRELIENAYFVAHNVPFDLSFIQEEFKRTGNPIKINKKIDTVELARILYPSIESYRLNDMADFLGLSHDNPHRADSDAEVTSHLLLAMLKKMKKLPRVTLQELVPILKTLKSNISDITENMLEENVNEDEKSFDLIDGLAIRKQEILGKGKQDLATYDFNIEKDDISQRLSQGFQQYEKRDGQLAMMSQVYSALNESRYHLIEAGTGVGKSLGYLLPSSYFSQKNQKPIVVSTFTTQLQQQLYEKDIPILRKVLPFPIEVTLIKGKQHYLCVHKFLRFLREEKNQNYDTLLTKAQLLVWLTETTLGDLEEVTLPSGGRNVWNRISSDSSCCENKENHKSCFFIRKLEQLKTANIIITNHALLLSDMVKADGGYLPDYDEVIIDEAHYFPDVASEHLGKRVNYLFFHSTLTQLGTLENGGILKKLNQLINNSSYSYLIKELQKIDDKLIHLKEELDELFRMLKFFVLEMEESRSDIGRLRYQYHLEQETHILWEHIIESSKRIKFNILDIIRWLRKVNTEVASIKDLYEDQRANVMECKEITNNLEELLNHLVDLLLKKKKDTVHWLEADEKGAANAAYLYAQPIDVAEELANSFFNKKKSVVLTSAVMTVNDSFTFIKEKFGINNLNSAVTTIPSPFHYKEQVKIFIPSETPLLKEVSFYDYVSCIAKNIAETALVTKGRMLVLFTSYQMLSATYQEVKRLMESDQFMLIGQGITSRSRDKLIKTFKQHPYSILFGTNSFWEGIDIPGDDLSCLIITRLPFTSPDQPLYKAKAKKLQKDHGNVFQELSLPLALMRFKQGFGRLIRTKYDKGALIVYDRRISSESYGKKFIEVLPSDIKIEETSHTEVLEKLREWL